MFFLEIPGWFWFVFIGIRLLFALIVVSMAERRGMNALLWVVIVLIFETLGLIIFFIVYAMTPAPENRVNSSGYSNVYRGSNMASPPAQGPPAAQVAADPDFADPHIDSLIQRGDLREARKQVAEMMQMAKEMGDKKGMANYRKYEAIISRASTQGKSSREPRY